MLKTAITGNIASGKTYVLEYLKKAGYSTLCLDEVVQKLYDGDLKFKSELIKFFGTDDKKKISNIVFDDKNKLKTLEQLIYPIVGQQLETYFKENGREKIVIVAVPMLFEAGFDKYFDKIIFVSANENLRLERLKKRNNLTKAEALKRIQAQIIETEKIKKSDIIIYNEGSLSELEEKCKKLTEELKLL